MIIHQLSVFLENKSGRLTEVLEVLEPKFIERSEGKAKHVIDKRKF